MADLSAWLRAAPGEDGHEKAVELLKKLEASRVARASASPGAVSDYDENWAALKTAVSPIAHQVASELRTNGNELVAELVSRMHESWIREWVLIAIGLEPGKSKAAYLFFYDRLRDSARASQRTQRRREAIARQGASDGDALVTQDGSTVAGISAAHAASPEDEVRQVQALGALAELSLRTKAAVALTVFGFSQQEIAAVTGTSPPTISRLLAAARVRLQRTVEGSEVHSGTWGRDPAKEARVRRFLEALGGLAPLPRAALTLRLRGFATREIAEVLGVSETEAGALSSSSSQGALADGESIVPKVDLRYWAHLLTPLSPVD